MRRFSLRRFSLRSLRCGAFAVEPSLRSLRCGAFAAEPSLRNLHCGAFATEPSLQSLHCGTFTANSHCGSPVRKLSFSASISTAAHGPREKGLDPHVLKRGMGDRNFPVSLDISTGCVIKDQSDVSFMHIFIVIFMECRHMA